MFTLHWKTALNPIEQTSTHANYLTAEAAESVKATEIQAQSWFKLWLDDAGTIIHSTEKF